MALPIRTLRSRAHQFVKDYADAVKENAESQSFLNDFFAIFDIKRRSVATYELAIKTGGDAGTKRADLLWPGTLLVEMKSAGQDLDKAFSQAVDYLKRLDQQDLPAYILVCDLQHFRLHHLESGEDHQFPLADLPDQLDLFGFMHGKAMQNITEFELNEKAALLLGELHDSLQYSGYEGHALQVFMVRVLFCMFAEDTGVFDPRQFVQYLLNFTREDGSDTELHLQKLFQILDTPEDKRSKVLTEEQAAFPYVNGQLFKERIDMPSFNAEMREMLISCCYFNWKEISPAVFGSLFQSIMDKQARRNLGAHYTSEQNILKVIGPLFLDDLQEELEKILQHKVKNTRDKRLMDFAEKLRHLKVLDPACGCGNFLIVTYRELRRLELKLMEAQAKGSKALGFEIQPQIPLDNFYGIELDEWPAQIAQVAMWLTQHQMNVEFAKSFGEEPDLLPLKEHAHIHNANALTLDWSEVVSPKELSYIIGNPPFVDRKERSKSQIEDQKKVIGHLKSQGILDFVSNWFYKSAIFCKETNISTAFISTNSICMGEQVGALWNPILGMGASIIFAHRTFKWSNDAKANASVYCVVVGFSFNECKNKKIYKYSSPTSEPEEVLVDRINPYLVDSHEVALVSMSSPLNVKNKMIEGITPLDNGILTFDSHEKNAILAKEPELDKYIKKWITGHDYINNKFKYCFWLVDAPPSLIRKSTALRDRIKKVKEFRESSKSSQKFAETPHLFREKNFPEEFVIIPKTSSQYRQYIPIGFLEGVIASSAVLILPEANKYEFGVLTSQMHMDWMRTVAGRLKSDYRYSATLVYNNFPWPNATDKQKQQIETLAQAVLDARQVEFDKDPETSLADLYDPDLMPANLRKAHTKLDKAVDTLYQPKGFKSPMERVQHLFKLYAKATAAI
ncbi:MAG: class I SAM-dependent DNA methyltransferase [Marinospirillum sp.]|uniref:class I SAM-dependent DNA methyltransferase n=1 Tax=Marinospirillum sp. TaxID=2183934 RepID=UPI001A0825ED|nr:DNA methyltransferase [Marinospirillum sp.]MBE0508763.1 class I SAM-dependent DNA methyltransferase [Marinospirillum sp.]